MHMVLIYEECNWRCTFTLLGDYIVSVRRIVESYLKSMHHGHIDSYEKCKKICTFT